MYIPLSSLKNRLIARAHMKTIENKKAIMKCDASLELTDELSDQAGMSWSAIGEALSLPLTMWITQNAIQQNITRRDETYMLESSEK